MRIENCFHVPSLSDVRLLGLPGETLARFAYERMESEAAWDVVYREAAEAFERRLDDANGVVGLWQGEFWGKLVISACRYAEYSGHEALKERLRRETLRFITLQEPDGYLGTYRDSLRMFSPTDLEASRRVMGWACDWNWNVWCRKYTLWGLLEAYRVLGDRPLLDAAVRLADHLLRQLAENHIRIQDTGTFGGLPSCSIIKPMLLLHDATGNHDYLQFAITCAQAFDDPSGRCPNLIANARTGRPIHDWYPNSQRWAKAYEMMSVLDGFCELYRHTGDRTYLDTAQTIHNLLRTHERNLLGSVGYNDIFAHAAATADAISEPCDHVHWMRLCHELYLLTGNLAYVDDFEACYLNAFQAAVFRDGRWGARGVRSHGRHFSVHEQAGMKHNHCCVNNLPRGYLNAAQLAVTYSDHGLAVNLYSPLLAHLRTPFGNFHVTIGDGLLPSGRLQLRIVSDAPHPVPVSLRIPAWSAHTTVTCRGITSTPPRATYCDVTALPLQETLIELQLDMTPHLHELNAPFRPVPPDDWRALRWCCAASDASAPYDIMLKQPRCTLTAGPILLARSHELGNSHDEMFGPHSLAGHHASCSLTPLPAEPPHAARFTATFSDPPHRWSTTVCDYGTAANALTDNPTAFSIFF